MNMLACVDFKDFEYPIYYKYRFPCRRPVRSIFKCESSSSTRRQPPRFVQDSTRRCFFVMNYRLRCSILEKNDTRAWWDIPSPIASHGLHHVSSISLPVHSVFELGVFAFRKSSLFNEQNSPSRWRRIHASNRSHSTKLVEAVSTVAYS